MARKLTKEELTNHKNSALKKLDAYLAKLIDSPDKKVNAKSDKLKRNISQYKRRTPTAAR